MNRPKIGRPLAAAAAFMASILCAQTAMAEPNPSKSPLSSRLSHRVIKVDGRSPTRVSPPGAATCRPTSAAEAEAALAITNSIRAQRRLAPLSTHQKLQRAAEAHACEMAGRGIMSHHGASGAAPMARVKSFGYRPKLTAENIAAGHFDMQRVHQEWSRSRGHLANILANSARNFGIGYAVGSDGKTIYWAAIYADGN